MTKRSLEDAVALLDLPSWEHVGAELLSHGIMDGQQLSCELCPIAQFLVLLTGRRVSVGKSAAHVFASSDGSTPLPEAVRNFIVVFDDILDNIGEA